MCAQVYGERWETIRQIGEGGQSHVFEVKDVKDIKQPYRILKRLKNLKRVDRFKRELEAVKAIEHPNVIKVLDYNLEDTKPYLVMEKLEGGSLADNIERWVGEPSLALRLFREVCNGVAAAHNLGIIHRDLKPENLLLHTPGGPPVVSDFGICYVEDGDRFTITEEAVGPRLYMAPELEDGRLDQVKPASDVYSLGKVLYALLSGGKTFSREKHREASRNLVALRSDEAMEHVNRLLDRMIATEPLQRFANAGEILAPLTKTIRLITYDYRAVSTALAQRCTYCGEGTYRSIVREGDALSVRNFGITPVGNPNWRILVCDHCGHVDFFRIENAKQKDWWT